MTKRVLAFLMVMAIVLSLVPTVVLAEETATPGYAMIMQKAHNQTDGFLAIDIYLQANTAEQADVTGYQFTVAPAEGLVVAAATDATGNDNLKGNENTFIYDPAANKPIAVGTSKVLVATISVAGETLPAEVKDAASLEAVTVTQAEADFAPALETIAFACTDHECVHGEGEWKTLPAANSKGNVELTTGNYYLTGDVTATLVPQKDAKINLCLNGYDVTAAKEKKCILIATTGVELTICDCTASGEGEDYTSGRLVPNHTWGGAIDVGADAGAKITMLGGTIDGTATDSVAAKGAGNGVYLRGGNNKFTAKGVKFVGLEGYTSNGAFYGPNIFRGTGTEGYFENCTFVDCGTAIIDANNGTGSVNDAVKLTVKDCVITDSQEGAHAIDVKHEELSNLTIEGNCQFDVPVYIANGQKPVTLNLGENTKISFLTAAEKTEEELNQMLVVPEGGAVKGSVIYENAGAYLSYADGKFTFSAHKHDNIGFKVWTDPTSLPTSGNWYLDTDVTLTEQIVIPYQKELTLDLNGHTITQTTAKERIFSISGILNLYDCQEGYDADGNWTGGNITGGTNSSGAAIMVQSTVNSKKTDARPTFNMYGGRISGNHTTSSGGAVYVGYSALRSGVEYPGAIFNMYGGEICNNSSAAWGGAITVMAYDPNETREGKEVGVSPEKNIGAQLNIYGGVIYGNTADNGKTENTKGNEVQAGTGGAIRVCYDGVVNIQGGEFRDNSAYEGGAIYATSGATVTVNNAVFDGNSSDDKQTFAISNGGSGGAIFANGAGTTVTITDTVFTNNTANRTSTKTSSEGNSDYAGFGGAIHGVNATVVVDGCTFDGNSTNRHAGAICFRNGGNLTVKNSSFTDNKANGVGGSMYLLNAVKAHLDNTIITGNYAKSNGGGVYVTSKETELYLSGKVIIAGNNSDATATVNGTKVQTPVDDVFFQNQTARTLPMFFVDELAAGSHIEAYNGVALDANVAVQLGTPIADKTATQTDWDCGRITVYNTSTDNGKNVSRVDGVFTYGHVHMIDGQAVTFQPLEGTAVPTDGGYYYLTEDITAAWNVQTDLNLCFNGKTFKVANSGDKRGIYVTGDGCTVNIYDCTATYTEDGTYLSGGITGSQYQNYGGAVRVQNAANESNKLNWYGGAIFGCTRNYTSSGSGIALFSENVSTTKGAVINWYDGAIHDNKMTGGKGTGVICIQGSSQMTIHKMAFYNNSNDSTGGMYISIGNNPVVVKDGYFFNNHTDKNGAVFTSVKKLTIEGGKFWGNSAANGGVIAASGATITGGEFFENTAINNGAVINTSAALTIQGGSFHDNVAGTQGTTTEAGTMGQGGVIYTSSNTTITGGSFENNIAYGWGGIAVQGSSGNVMTITGTEENPILFKGNQAIRYYKATTKDEVTTIALDSTAGLGGCFKLNNGTIDGDYVTFEGNKAYSGGVVSVRDGQGTKWVTKFDHTTFKDNEALVLGGALHITNGTLEVTNSVFENNKATTASYAKGGAICTFPEGSHKSGETTYTHKVTATIDNCDFIGNYSAYDSGAISPLRATTMTISNSDFEDNTAVNLGGAMRTENAATNLTIEKCNFKRNSTEKSTGGALCLKYIGQANVTDCLFENNISAASGGALFIDGSSNTSRWNFTRCTFTGNEAGNGGGVLYLQPDNDVYGNSGIVTFTDCVMTGNSANKAGAIYVEAGDKCAILNLENTTITGNTANDNGAVYCMGMEVGELILKGKTVIKDNICANENHGTDLCMGAKTVSGAPSNMKIDATALTEGASIGIAVTDTRLIQDPVVTKNSSAAAKDYFFCTKTDSMVLSTSGEELSFYRYIDEAGNAYATTQAYIEAQMAAGATKVVIPNNASGETITLAENVAIDLNGKEITKITVAEGKELTLIDSATNGYSAENAGSVVVEGTVKPYAEDTTNGLKRYVVITDEEGVSSAHRVYLAITAKVLRPTNNGVGFKAIFAGDEVVTANQDMFGIEIAVDPEFTAISKGFFTEMTAGIEGTSTPNQKTIILRDVLKEGMANDQSFVATIYGRPYIQIGEQVVYGTTVTTTMKDLAASALSNGDAVTKAAVEAMLAEFGMSAK